MVRGRNELGENDRQRVLYNNVKWCHVTRTCLIYIDDVKIVSRGMDHKVIYSTLQGHLRTEQLPMSLHPLHSLSLIVLTRPCHNSMLIRDNGQ
jgi:hypothetical protein